MLYPIPGHCIQNGTTLFCKISLSRKGVDLESEFYKAKINTKVARFFLLQVLIKGYLALYRELKMIYALIVIWFKANVSVIISQRASYSLQTLAIVLF